MHTVSRRRYLAAAGSALLAGCQSGDGGTTHTTPGTTARIERSTPTETRTATTTDRPEPTDAGESEPLGYRAVPDGVDGPPAFGRERSYEDEENRGVADLVGHRDGLDLLLYTRTKDGFGTPVLVRTGPTGAVTSRRTLSEALTNLRFLGRTGETTVVAAVSGSDETRTALLRGYRADREVFEHVPENGIVYTALTTVEGDFVLAGRDYGVRSQDDWTAVLERLRPDGTTVWTTRPGAPGVDTRFWTVATDEDRLLVGGDRNSEVWLAAFDPDGTERWQRGVPREEYHYVVEGLAVGDTGRYAVARTNQFATGNNHLLLLSLGREGRVEWLRRFDPNYGDGEAPRELYYAGVVDAGGPVVVGHSSRPWLGATDPDGGMRWAGYTRQESGPVLPTGAIATGDGVLLHGTVTVEAESGLPAYPWLGWLDP